MLRLYDAARNAYLRLRWLPLSPLVLHAHTNTVRSVVFLPDGKRMVSGSKDGSIRTWRVEDGEELGTVMKEGGAVVAVAASSDGRWIATGGSKRTITIWNAATNEKVIEWEAHTDWLRVLAFSPDSARVASGSRDQTAVIWSTTTGERLTGPLTPLEGHPGWVVFTEFSPDGDRIATGGGNLIRIWRSHISELIIPPIHVGAWSLVWTPNGQQLIAGCYDGLIKFFDASTGSLLAEWGGHTNIIFCMAISPNGNFFVSGSTDTTVRIWDTATRQQIGPALQHGGAVNSMDTSPDGTALRHGGAVNSVAISHDGRHLASGGRDREVRVWNLQDIIPRSLLKTTSTDALVNVHDDGPQQIPNSPGSSQEAPDTQNAKDDDKDEKAGKKSKSEGVDTTLQRCPSESSSLRAFLDCPAVAPIGGATDPSDQLYENLFFNDLPDAPPLVDELPIAKKRFSSFLTQLTRKKKGRGPEMQVQLEHQRSEAEGPVDPLPATAPQEPTAKDKGKQKESGPNAAPTEDTDCAFTPIPEPNPATSTKHVHNRATRIRQAIMRRERQAEHAYVAELRDRTIFASVRGPPLDEIERGCCFHFLSYIFYGQRDPNINPGANDAQPNAQLSLSDHGVAKTNSCSLGSKLNRLLVRLRVRKPPSASNTAPLSAIPSISSPHVDPDGASAPAPLFNQSRPAIVITSPSDTTKVPVHLSASSTSSSQTPSPPAQVLVSPASTGTNIDVDGAASEIEPNPRWLTDTERVDQASPSTERMEPLPTSASHSVTIQLTLSLHHGRGHNVMGVPALAPIPLSNQAASDIAITSPMNTTDVLVQVHPSASAPASIPLSNQSRPAIVITSLVNTTEVPVHPSAIPPSPSQTSPPPVQALLASASVDPNTDLDGPPSEIEPNPWQLTDTERVDLVSVECMAQLNLEDPWRNP